MTIKMEEDDELQQIRARRLAELQKQGQGAGGPAAGPGGRPNQPSQQDIAQQKEKEEEFRNSILSQILSQEARARCKSLYVHRSILIVRNLQ